MVEPGIYSDISNWQYHNDPKYHGLSKGGIDRLESTPAHFKAQLVSKNPPTAEMVFGSAFHTYTLQPENISKEIRVQKTVKKSDRDELALNAGKLLITPDQENDILCMQESLKASRTASGLINHADSVKEQSIFWDEATYGFRCKCRPDIMIPSLGILADVKTTRDANPNKFLKDALWNYNYFMQAAWYLTGINAVQETYFQTFLYICVEKSPPYAVAVYRATQIRLDDARAKIRPLLALYAECLKNDNFPGYPDEIMDL